MPKETTDLSLHLYMEPRLDGRGFHIELALVDPKTMKPLAVRYLMTATTPDDALDIIAAALNLNGEEA